MTPALAFSLTMLGAVGLRYALTFAARALDRHVQARVAILRRLMA